MSPFSKFFWNASVPIISWSASYKGRRYGSTFCCKSPGRKPSFSPASIAGRVRIILFTCACLKAVIAIAIARYVFPVPAGPIQRTIVLFLILSKYFFCPIVFGFIGFPDIVLQTVSSLIFSISLKPSSSTESIK